MLALLAALLLAQGCASGPGQWQGTIYPPATPDGRQDEFLVLDSGGTGGGFGGGETRHSLHDVFMVDARRVWAAGYRGVFRSSDGGFTWDRVLPAGAWVALQLPSPDEIWLLEMRHPGGPGRATLRHSSDGGLTWREDLPGQITGGGTLYCRGAERWVLQGNYGAFHSSDSGATWRRVDFKRPGFSPSRLAIPADRGGPAGFAVYVLGGEGGRRALLKSEDGGATWRKLESLPPPGKEGWRQSLFFATSEDGWVGAEDGSIHATSDGGATWRACPLPESRPIIAMWFDQRGRGYASVINNDILHPGVALYGTKDGGATWTVAAAGAKLVNAISGLGPGRLILVGDAPGFVRNDLVMLPKP